MIEVSINNTIQQFEEALTIEEALNKLAYKRDAMLGVAHNKTFVAKDDWAKTLLQHKDELDILNPINGG